MAISKVLTSALLLVVGVATTAAPAFAQVAPRTFETSAIRDSCVRQHSDPPFCEKVNEMVEGRYGRTVTMMQWNSQVGVYSHKRRQGKI